MEIKTAEDYISSLREQKRVVYYNGERVEDITTHPGFVPHINAAAKTYEMACRPEFEDLATAVSHLTGERISRFTHIHQLKAVGGEEDGMPVMTLTLRKGSPDILQLRYAESDEQVTLTTVPLSVIKGKWIAVREEVMYDEAGAYDISLTDIADSSEIFHFWRDTIRMWRTGAAFIRPKWGIYRSLNHAEQLRDEEVLFNDFLIWKISYLSADDLTIPVKIVVYPNPVTDILHFDFPGFPDIMFTRMYDVTGRVIRENHARGLRHIDVSSLPGGVYYLEFRKGPEVFMRKIIRE
jgi:hypothetical protein